MEIELFVPPNERNLTLIYLAIYQFCVTQNKLNPLFKKLLIYLFIVMCNLSCHQTEAYHKILPASLWRDSDGNAINAHGGGILKKNHTYYWFGEYREDGADCKGISCYSSKDLYHWDFEGLVLEVDDDTSSAITHGCLLERPKVVYNERTGKYVMWFHHELKGQGYSAALTGLAVSDNVTGPYKYIKSLRPNAGHWPINYPDELKNKTFNPGSYKRGTSEWKQAVIDGLYLHQHFAGGQMSRDLTIYIDEDGTAYHIHSSESNQTLHISELSEDYTSFSGKYIRVHPGGGNEAPVVFKWEEQFYLLTSGCTGWKPNAARLSKASSLLGNWTELGNPCKGTIDERNSTFWSQGTFIIKHDNQYIFMADRWLPENIAESRYVWLPFDFETNTPALNWKNEWELRIR